MNSGSPADHQPFSFRLTHFTDQRTRQMIADARKADIDHKFDEGSDASESVKGKGKAPARKSKSKRRPKKKTKKAESEDEDENEDEYEGEDMDMDVNEDDEEEGRENFEDVIIQSKREWEKENRDRRSGGESSKRH
jgi:hypothetical protein